MTDATMGIPRAAAVPVGEQRVGVLWLSSLRALAGLGVVIAHTALIYMSAIYAPGSHNWWTSVTLIASVRWCMPIFVLISGALLLDPAREESFPTFARKRAGRILVPLVFWTAFYLLWRIKLEGFSVSQIPAALLSGDPFYHLWYLYMIPGLYLFTPFLRTYLRAASARERAYLVVILLAWTAMSEFITAFRRPYTPTVFQLFLPYLGYYIAGYHLRMSTRRFPPALLVLGVVIGVLLTAVSIGFVAINYPDTYLYRTRYDTFSVPMLIGSFSLFLLFRQCSANLVRFSLLAGGLNAIAAASLGIYLLHPVTLEWIFYIIGTDSYQVSPLLDMFLVTIVCVAFSYLVTVLLRRIPLLRHTV